MVKNKKSINITGSIVMPLMTGKKAVIFHKGGYIRTSLVEAIKQVSAEYILFETVNSVYCVRENTTPTPAALAEKACA